MVSEGQIEKPAVLHVVCGGGPAVRQMSDQLGKTGLGVNECRGVYRALARLVCADPSTPYAAAVVCVDGLDRQALEFISIVGRDFPAVRLFVYGDPRCSEKLLRAVEFGAKVIHRDEPIAISQASEAGVVPQAAGTLSGQAPSVLELDCVQSTSGSQDRQEQKPAAAVRARVPWLRYNKVPKRVPPLRSARTKQIEERAGAGPAICPPAEVPEPLLLPEELDALLGGPLPWM